MTATLTPPVEALLQEQVANGQFENIDSAIEAAVKTVFGRRASKALESLLDEAVHLDFPAANGEGRLRQGLEAAGGEDGCDHHRSHVSGLHVCPRSLRNAGI